MLRYALLSCLLGFTINQPLHANDFHWRGCGTITNTTDAEIFLATNTNQEGQGRGEMTFDGQSKTEYTLRPKGSVGYQVGFHCHEHWQHDCLYGKFAMVVTTETGTYSQGNNQVFISENHISCDNFCDDLANSNLHVIAPDSATQTSTYSLTRKSGCDFDITKE